MYLIEEHQRRRKQHLHTLSRNPAFETIKKEIETEIETGTLRARYVGMGQRDARSTSPLGLEWRLQALNRDPIRS